MGKARRRSRAHLVSLEGEKQKENRRKDGTKRNRNNNEKKKTDKKKLGKNDKERKRSKSHDRYEKTGYSLRRTLSSSSLKSNASSSSTKSKHKSITSMLKRSPSYNLFEDDDFLDDDICVFEHDEFSRGSNTRRSSSHHHSIGQAESRTFSDSFVARPYVEFDVIEEENDAINLSSTSSRHDDSFSNFVLERINHPQPQNYSMMNTSSTSRNRSYTSTAFQDITNIIDNTNSTVKKESTNQIKGSQKATSSPSLDSSFSHLILERTRNNANSNNIYVFQDIEKVNQKNSLEQQQQQNYISDKAIVDEEESLCRSIRERLYASSKSNNIACAEKVNLKNSLQKQQQQNYISDKAIVDEEESLCRSIRDRLYASSKSDNNKCAEKVNQKNSLEQKQRQNYISDKAIIDEEESLCRSIRDHLYASSKSNNNACGEKVNQTNSLQKKQHNHASDKPAIHQRLHVSSSNSSSIANLGRKNTNIHNTSTRSHINDEESLSSTIRQRLYVSSVDPSNSAKLGRKNINITNPANDAHKNNQNKEKVPKNIRITTTVTKHESVSSNNDCWLSHFSPWPYSGDNNNNIEEANKDNAVATTSSSAKNITSIMSSPILPCELLTHFWGESTNNQNKALEESSKVSNKNNGESTISPTSVMAGGIRRMVGLPLDKEEEDHFDPQKYSEDYDEEDYDDILLSDCDLDENSVIDDGDEDNSITEKDKEIKERVKSQKRKKTTFDPIYSAVSYESAHAFVKKLCSTGIPLKFYNYPDIGDSINNDNDNEQNDIDYTNWESVPVVLYLTPPSQGQGESKNARNTKVTSPKLTWIVKSTKSSRKVDNVNSFSSPSSSFVSHRLDTDDIYCILKPQDVDSNSSLNNINSTFLHLSLSEDNSNDGMERKCFSITTAKGQVYVFDTSKIPSHHINPVAGNLTGMFDQDCIDELSRDYVVHHLRYILNRLDMIVSFMHR